MAAGTRGRGRTAAGPGGAALVVCLCLCLFLSGCRGAGPETVITSPVTITFWHAQEGQAAALLEKLAAEFSSEEPLVTVECVYRGEPAALAAALVEAVAGGEGPAVAEVPEASLSSLRAAGALRPLESFMVNRHYGFDVSDTEDFWPCLVESNTAEGRVWGLPFSHEVYALVYRPDLVPEPPTTWDELREAVTALTVRSPDLSRCSFGLAVRADADLFCLFLYQNGGALQAGDPPRYCFNDVAGVVALDFLYELSCMRRSVLVTMGDPLEAVVDGRAAMTILPVRWPLRDPALTSLAAAPLPTGVRRATLAPGSSLVICAGRSPAEEEAAWRFMRWLTGSRNAARWAVATGYVPVRRSALEEPEWRAGPGRDPAFSEVVAQLEWAAALPDVESWPEVEERLSAAVYARLFGQVNSSEALLDAVLEAGVASGP